MDKLVRITLLVMVNQFLAKMLGIDTFEEWFWFLLVILTNMIYVTYVTYDVFVRGNNE